jgi:hypothetical protein
LGIASINVCIACSQPEIRKTSSDEEISFGATMAAADEFPPDQLTSSLYGHGR